MMFSNKRVISFAVSSIWTIFIALSFGLNFSVKAQTDSCVEELVKSLSDGKLKLETKATPYKLTGDFDGDKIEDLAVVVSLSDTVGNIEKKVKIENPYARAWGNEINTDLLALFIIHGKGKGW